MNMRKYITDLQEKGRLSFTLQEALSVLNTTKGNLLSSISFFKKKGELVSPLKGFYVIVPIKDRKRGGLQPQDMIVLGMKYLEIPYYAGLLTAASYHGATHQSTQVFQVITNKRIRSSWVIGKLNIEFIYKKEMATSCVEQRVVSTGFLNISTAEQTAKDIMIYTEKGGGINHQATILAELIEKIDTRKMIRIAKTDTKRTWIQRMGYILSKIESINPKKKGKVVDALASFLKDKKYNFIPLAPELNYLGHTIDTKWKIIENTTIESDI